MAQKYIFALGFRDNQAIYKIKSYWAIIFVFK